MLEGLAVSLQLSAELLNLLAALRGGFFFRARATFVISRHLCENVALSASHAKRLVSAADAFHVAAGQFDLGLGRLVRALGTLELENQLTQRVSLRRGVTQCARFLSGEILDLTPDFSAQRSTSLLDGLELLGMAFELALEPGCP